MRLLVLGLIESLAGNDDLNRDHDDAGLPRNARWEITGGIGDYPHTSHTRHPMTRSV